MGAIFQFPNLSPSPPTFTRVLAVLCTVRRSYATLNLRRRIILNLKTGWDFYNVILGSAGHPFCLRCRVVIGQVSTWRKKDVTLNFPRKPLSGICSCRCCFDKRQTPDGNLRGRERGYTSFTLGCHSPYKDLLVLIFNWRRNTWRRYHNLLGYIGSILRVVSLSFPLGLGIIWWRSCYSA